MSIQTEIERLNNAKTEIAEAITEKGIDVPQGTSLDVFPSLVRSIPQDGGSENNVFIVDATIDLTNISVSSISHTYNEVIELLELGKLGFFRIDFGQGDAYGHITSYNASESRIYYQVMATFDFGDGTKLYFFCIIQSIDTVRLNVYLVPTTGIGG